MRSTTIASESLVGLSEKVNIVIYLSWDIKLFFK